MLCTMFSGEFLVGYSAILNVVAAAGCYGWITPIMNYLLDPKSDMYMTSAQAAFTVAIIDGGELFLSLPVSKLSDMYGRKVLILVSGPIYVGTWMIILFWKSYIVLCAMRIVQGVAMAISFAILPLYLGEIASPSHRGSISSLFSLAWYLGFLIEYSVGPLISYELFTIFTACIPLIFTVGFLFQPESPYYLLMKDNERDARVALKWLRNGRSEDLIEKELEEMKETVRNDMKNKPKWTDIVSTPADKRALLVIILLGTIRVMSGAIAIQSFSTNLFSKLYNFFLPPDILTIILGLFLLIGGGLNSFFVDSLGRRILLFISCGGASISLLTVALYFYLKDIVCIDVLSYSWMVPSGVLMYCLFFVLGLHPVSMIYTSELFTTKTRATAASLSTMNLTIWSFICIELYQIIGDSYGLFFVFCFYGSVPLLGALVLYFLAPETKGKTFSQIRNDIFNVLK